jgi:hypothetical protein
VVEFDEDLIEQLHREARKRGLLSKPQETPIDVKGLISRLRQGLHAEQREMYDGKGKRKVVFCGRRSGKTSGLGRIILAAALEAEGSADDYPIVGYVGPTRRNAKRLMWGRLKMLCEKYNIEAKFVESELICRLPTGCEVWIMGADKERDIERMRGFAFTAIVVDEAQLIGNMLMGMVEEVIEPALADYNGTLILSGTPPPVLSGFFVDAATQPEYAEAWERYHWDVRDNPFFPQWRGVKNYRHLAEKFLEAERKKHGWTDTNPTYRREWLAEFVRDDASLVFSKYDRQRNDYVGTLPAGKDWRYILGVDLGYDDEFVIEVVAYSLASHIVYEVEQFGMTKAIPSQWAEEIKRLNAKYHPERIMVDTGGLGKAVVAEFRARYGIAAIPAK